MDLYCRDADDLSDIKRAILNGYLNEDDDDESDGNENSDVEEFYEELKEYETKPGQNCDASPKEDDEEFGSALRIIFGEESLFPIPSNLVSAMKGSREKQGILPKKLTVAWAPDVYDPAPSIGTVQLTRGMKQKKSKKNNNENNKKSGKKGQKGSNSSRGGGGGGGGKDKKHLRRGGSSEQSDGVDEFEVGSPDPYCGSSFLKKSHTKMHYSVAEAL
ncbi:hypothetical protein SLA2020_131090 [Shorea laevis]